MPLPIPVTCESKGPCVHSSVELGGEKAAHGMVPWADACVALAACEPGEDA